MKRIFTFLLLTALPICAIELCIPDTLASLSLPAIPLLFGMILEQQTRLYTPADWAPAAVATTLDATLLGTTKRFPIPRQNPIEEIWIVLSGKTDTTGQGPTPRSGSTGIVGRDNIMGIVKRVTLDCVSPTWGAYKMTDCSGAFLLEYNMNAGMNIDPPTWEYLRLWQAAATPVIAVDTQFQVAYRVPVVYPMVGEPLLTRCLLPCHTWAQDPVLTVDFEAATNIYSAGHIVDLRAEIWVVYREMNGAQTDDILSKGGFIQGDLLESSFSPGVGVAGEQRFQVNPPGSYMALLFRQYLGGNAVCTRNIVDQTTTFGSESTWRLESNGNVKRQWRWKHLQAKNAYSRAQTMLSQTSDVTVNAAVASGTLFAPAASCLLDFCSDGLEPINELGSVLDVNIPARSGLKMEVVGSWAAPASSTIASTIFYGGHRLWGDLSAFKSNRANLG